MTIRHKFSPTDEDLAAISIENKVLDFSRQETPDLLSALRLYMCDVENTGVMGGGDVMPATLAALFQKRILGPGDTLTLLSVYDRAPGAVAKNYAKQARVAIAAIYLVLKARGEEAAFTEATAWTVQASEAERLVTIAGPACLPA